MLRQAIRSSRASRSSSNTKLFDYKSVIALLVGAVAIFMFQGETRVNGVEVADTMHAVAGSHLGREEGQMFVDEWGNVQSFQDNMQEGSRKHKTSPGSDAKVESIDAARRQKRVVPSSFLETQDTVLFGQAMTDKTWWIIIIGLAVAGAFTLYHCVIYCCFPPWKAAEEGGEAEGGEPKAEGEGGDAVPDNASDDIKPNETEEFEENMYMATAVVLIKDVEKLVNGTGNSGLRFARIFMTLLLQFGNIGLQMFLLVCLKQLVMRRYTNEIRDLYDSYHAAGGPFNAAGEFDEAAWETWDADTKADLCQMPLSQPGFFYAILIVWAMTILKEIRSTYFFFDLLVMKVPTVSSIKDGLTRPGEEALDSVITGVTGGMKFALIVLVFLPKFFIAATLLWMGSRWLCATPSFADLILNAVALEFILAVDDLIYEGILSKNQVRDVQHTTIENKFASVDPTISGYLFELIWFVFASSWAYVYMYYIQQVLPDYKFDVAKPCSGYIEEEYALKF